MATSEPGKTVENCFPKAPIDIKINDVQEPTPLRIIRFQKYIQQCAINMIPIKGNTLGLLGADSHQREQTRTPWCRHQ